MKLKTIIEHKFFKPATGAALATMCGLVLWSMPVGEAWENVSYDYLFRFGARPVTNEVALILMDNAAFAQFGQVRNQIWSRTLHTKLLNKLADDGCPLVVFDMFFGEPGDSAEDKALAEAMRRQRQVVVGAKEKRVALQIVEGSEALKPTEPFLSAVRTNWGVAKLLTNKVDAIVRQHWPFPSPDRHPSLPWTAARLAGAELSDAPEKRWLRYYGHFDDPYCRMDAARTNLSYGDALTQSTSFFHDKIVFVGSWPTNSEPGFPEKDKFRTPYTRWTREAVGGVGIIATEFLNLKNGDWLRRPAWWVEALVLSMMGALLGGGLCQVRWWAAWLIAGGAALAVMLGAVYLSYFSNYWFPWLLIACGQVPCALAWALVAPKVLRSGAILGSVPAEPDVAEIPGLVALGLPAKPASNVPDPRDYELFNPPFGEGAYGKVWLVRNAIGQWQALKAVYQAKFGQNSGPYETEFKGIKRYKPVSEKHPGLLRVDFVSKKRDGYFYYVMELGDALTPGWEENPTAYKPCDLATVRAQAEGRRLPVRESVRIIVALAEALDFLHRQNLTHRDIKPANVIFVNGQPKLADVGLVAEIRAPEAVTSYAGTPGYMPPMPERPGTVQADIYALGMVFYVISTGREPAFFPDLSTSLIEQTGGEDFIRLNPIILKACQPDCAQRYASAAEMHAALLNLQKALEASAPTQRPGAAPKLASSSNRIDPMTKIENRNQVEEFSRKHRLALLTLMFTDIVGATKLKNDLGDPRAIALIQQHHELVRMLLTRFRESKEIETAGDSFLLVFATPSDAVRFSLILQSRLRELARLGSPCVLDRIGIHLGEVMVEEHESESKDLFGMQLDICARVMSLAQGGQILMTRSTFDNARQSLKGQKMTGMGELAWKNHGLYSLAGVQYPVEICEVGETGLAPLAPPSDSEKVRRCVPDT